MIDSKVLPLSDVCPSMAGLVSDQGWLLIQSDGILGYNTRAIIEKDGVVISYFNSKGEQDYGVRLARAVHPVLSGELNYRPGLIDVLAAIGLQPSPSDVVFQAAKNLSAIKTYLSDQSIWKENVGVTTENLLNRYKTWSDGPDLTRDLANSLAGRHPWLTASKVPDLTDLLNTEQFLSYKPRRSHLGIVIGAVGVGMVVAHYWI
jgi:hypothetical protein